MPYVECRACKGTGMVVVKKRAYTQTVGCKKCGGRETVYKYDASDSQSNEASDNQDGRWTPRRWGVVGDDHEVTFRVGIGKDNEGQTLISDGHVDKDTFFFHHSHYGPSNKALYPDQPDLVEDSDNHKNDDAYTRPDC